MILNKNHIFHDRTEFELYLRQCYEQNFDPKDLLFEVSPGFLDKVIGWQDPIEDRVYLSPHLGYGIYKVTLARKYRSKLYKLLNN